MSEWMLIVSTFIPSTLIDPLTEDLNRRLSTILFDLGHVQVINENNTLHTNSGSKVILSQFGQFTIDNVLNLIASGLSRESNINGEPFVSWELLKDILDVFGLTSTGWTNEHDWLSLLLAHQKLKHVAVLDLVRGGNDDLIGDSILGELIEFIFVDEVVPGLPRIKIRLVAVIIDGTLVKARWTNLMLQFDLLSL
jgi:hypothetical protein